MERTPVPEARPRLRRPGRPAAVRPGAQRLSAPEAGAPRRLSSPSRDMGAPPALRRFLTREDDEGILERGRPALGVGCPFG
jgi:hypothetical protein